MAPSFAEKLKSTLLAVALSSRAWLSKRNIDQDPRYASPLLVPAALTSVMRLSVESP
ncbi:hypothetical protein D3C73_956280 [compost metagenome]